MLDDLALWSITIKDGSPKVQQFACVLLNIAGLYAGIVIVSYFVGIGLGWGLGL